jgi:hypothetical protein
MLIKILTDTSFDDSPAVRPGTVLEAMIDPKNGEAWYFNPVDGTEWFTMAGDYEVVDA